MKAIGKLVLGALILAGTAIAAAPAAEAQWYGAGAGYGYGRPGAHFSLGFGSSWTTGRWVHGWHGPRYGWWWSVGDSWYLYPRPVYPYPAYLPPPVADGYGYDFGYGYGQDYRRDRNYVESYQAPDTNPQRPDYWYFCRNPEGYYPYVQDCDDWQQELAQGGPPPGDYPEYDEPDFQREP